MYCGNCGKRVNENDLFCGNCGTKLNKNDINIKTDKTNSIIKISLIKFLLIILLIGILIAIIVFRYI